MSELQDLNLKDLIHRYRDKTQAIEAVNLLKNRRGDDLYLGNLLRHHSTPVENSEEIYLRDAVDDLLGFYSIVEIACLVHLVAEELPSEFRSNALADLSEPAVQSFYEHHYRLLLPILFRKRLEGIHHIHERHAAECTHLFMQMLDLNEFIERDKHVRTFLMFLDDFEIEGFSRNDLLALLENPNAFMEHIGIQPDKQSRLDQALHGCCKFLKFYPEFDDLLKRSKRYSVFQSAAWHYHSYWFDHHELGPIMREALNRLSGWRSTAVIKAENFAETARSIRALGSAVNDLASGKYRSALERQLRRVR